ncbi:MAG TPA: ArsA-related P-loop ATPase [Candidatus Binataceae bacterium]
MNRILSNGNIILLLGTGGVGKTTIATALGVAAASRRLDTALITVDPSKRLRDALGLEQLGGTPLPIDAKRLRAAGLDESLKLSAMVIDSKGAWDNLVGRFAKDPATHARLLQNPFYRSLTEQFAGSESYAALQQLYDLHSCGKFAIEIVDTPPASHAFDFILAPARLTRLLDSRAARMLFAPYASASHLAMKLAGNTARFVVRELERFAGVNVLTSIGDFFAAVADTIDSVISRFKKTEALLRAPSVHFVMVTTAEEDRLRQARDLIHEMERERLKLSAIVINRFLDEESWREMRKRADPLPMHLDEIKRLNDCEQLDPRLAPIASFLANYALLTKSEIDRVRRFAREMPSNVSLITAPEIQIGADNLRAVARLAQYLTGDAGLGHPGFRRASNRDDTRPSMPE